MSFTFSSQYQAWLGQRKDNANNRRLFAKLHFGNMGRENITGTSKKNVNRKITE